MKRRSLLVGSTVLVSGLAGCAGLVADSGKLDLTLFNHSVDPYTVEMSLFRSGADSSRSDAREFSGSIDVEPRGRAERAEIATVQPYIIRYSAYRNNSKLTDRDHVHYYPADTGADDGQAFDIDASGVLTRR